MPLARLAGKRWSGYLSWRRRRRFVHRAEVLDRLTAAVAAERPEQILVTGDLVHVGLPAEIDAAAHWLERLGPPERVLLVPGNHDVYARDSWPALARAWRAYLPQSPGDDASGFPVLRVLGAGGRRLSLVGVSSAVPSPLFMAYGRIGASQLGRLDRLLAAAPGFRCLLLHHPPLPGMTGRRKGLVDAARLAQILGAHGAELVLHGHVHHNVCHRHSLPHLRIYGTASASSASAGAPASYRRFDVSAEHRGWQVAMALVTVAPDGSSRVVAEDRWRISRATAPADAP